MTDSTDSSKSWYNFDIKTRTLFTLSLEMSASIIGIIGFLLSEDGGGKVYKKSVRDLIGLSLTSFTELLVLGCIIVGFYGVCKKRPSLLAPYLICKSYYFIGIFLGIILSWPFLVWYIEVTGFFTVLIPGSLLLILKINSAWIVYTCYKQMSEDMRRQASIFGPELSDSALQYNSLHE